MDFWSEAAEEFWFQDHPHLEKVIQHLHNTYAVTFWVDGIKYHNATEGILVSYSSMTASGSAWDCKFPLAFIPASMIAVKAVRLAVFTTLCDYIDYSLEITALREMPKVGFYHEEFLEGTKRKRLMGVTFDTSLLYMGWKGDAPERTKSHGFTHHHTATFICDDCQAVQLHTQCRVPVLNYANFAPDAPHRFTKISHEDEVARGGSSPWLRVRGHRKENCFRDDMHNILIGTGQDLCGSAIIEVVESGEIHIAAEVALMRFNRKFEDFCASNNLAKFTVSLTMDKLGRTSRQQFPKLPNELKAAKTKVYMAFVAQEMIDRADPGSSLHTKMRAVCMWAMIRYLNVCDGAGIWMTRRQASQARKALQLHLRCYHWLCHEAITQGRVNWKLRPKFHYLDETADRLLHSRLNPRAVHNLREEDFAGRMSMLARACPSATMTHRFFQRYMLYMTSRWHNG